MDLNDVSRRMPDCTEIDVLISPGSDRSGMEGFDEWRKRIIIKIRSPPLDGKANKEVESLVRQITGCRAEIIRGHMGRQKTIIIHGDHEAIMSSLRCVL